MIIAPFSSERLFECRTKKDGYFGYDTAPNGIGRLASVDEIRPSGLVSDAFGAPPSFQGASTRATYPQAGNAVLTWAYDEQGRQVSVRRDGLAVASGYSYLYNGDSAVETIDFPQSNRQERISYNERMQPVLRQVIDLNTKRGIGDSHQSSPDDWGSGVPEPLLRRVKQEAERGGDWGQSPAVVTDCAGNPLIISV